jgi:hypothetical protein
MELLGDEAHVESYFDQLGDSVSAGAIYVLDRCTVCSKLTIASKIILDTKGSEIVFDAPNGTPW